MVVPGHGALVDRDFVEQQRQDIAITAQTIRDLAAAGVPVDRALDEGEWPFASEALANAVTPRLRTAASGWPCPAAGSDRVATPPGGAPPHARGLERTHERASSEQHDHGSDGGPDDGSDDGPLTVPDEALPEDLRPSDDNPLAEPAGDDVPDDLLEGDLGRWLGDTSTGRDDSRRRSRGRRRPTDTGAGTDG